MTYIIAEAGSNHNQDLDTARRLIDVAAEAGVDAIKFQLFSPSRIAIPALRSVFRDTFLPLYMVGQLFEHARHGGIEPLCTPFDNASLDFLMTHKMRMIKIASGDITYHPLLEHAAGKGRPIILSTGASTSGEIESALGVIGGVDQKIPVILLHCVPKYPTPAKEATLGGIKFLRSMFGSSVGYSDHTMSTYIPVAAAAMGAAAIEKHFTLDRSQEGPDHAFALEPDELKTMVEQIRIVDAANEVYLPSSIAEDDRNIRHAIRRAIYAVRAIKRGECVDETAIDYLRPAGGLAPSQAHRVIGHRAICDIAAFEPILPHMVD